MSNPLFAISSIISRRLLPRCFPKLNSRLEDSEFGEPPIDSLHSGLAPKFRASFGWDFARTIPTVTPSLPERNLSSSNNVEYPILFVFLPDLIGIFDRLGNTRCSPFRAMFWFSQDSFEITYFSPVVVSSLIRPSTVVALFISSSS